MKNQKGITLITLIITIVVLVILTATITINAPALLDTHKKTMLENDIEALKEEIDQYYARYKSLPIINKYTNVNMLNEVKNINDSENYYVIDLSKITVDLNYGKDYAKIKEKDVLEEITDMLDVYIINEQSHTIYYPKGIELEGDIYYTTNENYTQISNVNVIKTYRDNAIVVTENKEIKDSLGNKVVIPAGFKIAEDSGLTVGEGIVIEDNDVIEGIGNNRGNQYVWIPVGEGIKKSDGTEVDIILGRYVFADGTNHKDKDGNVLAKGTPILKQNIDDYTNQTDNIKINNNYYEDITQRVGVASGGLDGLNTTALSISNFKTSVEKNKGYYIARYEASFGVDGKVNSKVSNSYGGAAPTTEGTLWNCITQIDAAMASRELYKKTVATTDLINSYAWDTAIVYIQAFSSDTDYSYQDGYSINDSLTNTGVNRDEVCKINDMASNTQEWTTEYSTITTSSSSYPFIGRSGYYNDNKVYTSYRFISRATYSGEDVTFRSMLYI